MIKQTTIVVIGSLRDKLLPKHTEANGPVAHLRLFILSKLMVTFLKNETYGYGSR